MANKELRALFSVSNNVLLPTVLSDGRCSDKHSSAGLLKASVCTLTPLGLDLH